jgi:carbamoylphosphate synthase small subunit
MLPAPGFRSVCKFGLQARKARKLGPSTYKLGCGYLISPVNLRIDNLSGVSYHLNSRAIFVAEGPGGPRGFRVHVMEFPPFAKENSRSLTAACW